MWPTLPSVSSRDTMARFRCPNFVVATLKGNIVQINEQDRNGGKTGGRGRQLVRGFDGDVYALAAHPLQPLFVAGTHSGALHIWNTELRQIVSSRNFSKDESQSSKKRRKQDKASDAKSIRCVKFSHQGDLVAVAFDDGGLTVARSEGCVVSVPDPIDGEDADEAVANGHVQDTVLPPLSTVASFKVSSDTVVKAVFSHDGRYLATADASNHVALFKLEEHDENGNPTPTWTYIGRVRSHYEPVAHLGFLPPTIVTDETGRKSSMAPRLISLGQDRVLHEYDVAHSSIAAGLQVKNTSAVGKVATPLALVSGLDGNRLIVSTDEYKLQEWAVDQVLSGSGDGGAVVVDRAGSVMLRQTVLAPTYGGPLTELSLLPESDPPCLLYSTGERMIGLVQCPLDGNPHKSMAVIAHPGPIAACVTSYDGKFVLTAGGPHRCVNLWKADPTALQASAAEAGDGIDTFMALIEGGDKGPFYQELTDYFYYAQLQHQGLEATAERRVTGLVPIERVASLMRALGFYPTEEQAQDMVKELRLRQLEQGVADGEQQGQVSLADFTKLFINHRPVFGLDKSKFAEAFAALGAGEAGGSLSTEALVRALGSMGENMSEEELEQCLRSLMDRPKVDGLADEYETAKWRDVLPEQLNSEEFAQYVLGFNDYA